ARFRPGFRIGGRCRLSERSPRNGHVMNERTIFLAALEIGDPAERASYLEQACSADVALRQQVEALLAAHQREGSFLDVPAVAQLAQAAGQPAEVTAATGALAADEAFAAAGPPAEDLLAVLAPSQKPGS